jgi:hypothetical protein
MGFDTAWFDELRKLDQNVIGQVPVGGRRIYPDINDLWYDNSTTLKTFSNRFFEELMDLTNYLRKTGFKFYEFFKIAGPSHIINFPEGTCCICQWNIGFTAGDSCSDDFVRVGIGFRLNDQLEQNSFTSYESYIKKVAHNQNSFNSVFTAPIDHSEPEALFKASNFALAVMNDNVNRWDDWRFFGRAFRCSNPADSKILQNTQVFAREAQRCFQHIARGGFSC